MKTKKPKISDAELQLQLWHILQRAKTVEYTAATLVTQAERLIGRLTDKPPDQKKGGRG